MKSVVQQQQQQQQHKLATTLDNASGSTLAPGSSAAPQSNLGDDDIFKAWEVLSPAGHSVLTKSQLLDNLKVIFPANQIGAKEVRDLVGPGNMSVDKLRSLLSRKDLPAFSLLDTSASGFVDPGLLKHMLLQLPGIDKLDEADMQLIASLADSDGDGRMSLEDFLAIGSWVPEREPVTEGVKKALAVKAVDRAGANRYGYGRLTIGLESRWRPLELCYWPDQGALPAKGKEYPGLGYKRLRDKPPKAQEQQQQPAEAQ
ncbi:hypothetical protein QJQ45_009525 [Haematococcus lacustris]|nr:hypothetical protein QJQ45_009525 [Haematococcus lacustris]